MKDDLQTFHIRIHQVDGFTRTFVIDDAEKADSALMKMDASLMFERDLITLADGYSEVTLPTAQLTRIDLITDRLSVWDFPFVVGAPTEMSEADFSGCVANSMQADPNQSDDLPAFLKIIMAQQQSLFLCMEVVGGMPAIRLSRLQSMLKRKSLVFGLQPIGIGIINLNHLTHFSIHPEPTGINGVTSDSGNTREHTRFASEFAFERHHSQNG